MNLILFPLFSKAVQKLNKTFGIGIKFLPSDKQGQASFVLMNNINKKISDSGDHQHLRWSDQENATKG
jgi:hypothetical protein